MGRNKRLQKQQDNRARLRREIAAIIAEVYPDCVPVFSGNADSSRMGRRSVTLGFRLRDKWGKFRSNMIWLNPEYSGRWTAEAIVEAVNDSNG